MAANMGPSTVTTGIIAFFSTCLKITGASLSPFARAVSVKSARTTSSTAARVKRATMPSGPRASVSVGSTHARGDSQPPVGKSGTTSENRMMRKTARTKLGTATPAVATLTET